MLRHLLLLFMVTLGFSAGAEELSGALKFELNSIPELAQYKNLLTIPSYAALALQNSGLALSQTMPIEIVSRVEFKLGPASLKFLKEHDNVYEYNAGLRVPLGVVDKIISLPMKIDANQINNGKLQIFIYPPLKNIIPEDLIIRLDSRLKVLASLSSQKQLFSYLSSDEISHGSKAIDENMLEMIAIDSINQRVRGKVPGMPDGSVKDAGASEPFSDQVVLLVSLLIWLAGFPVFLYVLRRQRLKQAH